MKELLELVLLKEDFGESIYSSEAIKYCLYEKPRSVDDDGDDNYNDHHLALTRRVGARRTEMRIT